VIFDSFEVEEIYCFWVQYKGDDSVYDPIEDKVFPGPQMYNDLLSSMACGVLNEQYMYCGLGLGINSSSDVTMLNSFHRRFCTLA